MTVSVSLTCASFIVTAMLSVLPTSSSTSLSTTDENPESSAWMVYLPGGSRTRRYSPFSLVTAVDMNPVS